jgi:hypothetical protein
MIDDMICMNYSHDYDDTQSSTDSLSRDYSMVECCVLDIAHDDGLRPSRG